MDIVRFYQSGVFPPPEVGKVSKSTNYVCRKYFKNCGLTTKFSQNITIISLSEMHHMTKIWTQNFTEVKPF